MAEHSNVITEHGRREAHVTALRDERAAVASRPAEGAGAAIRQRRLAEIDDQLSVYGEKPNGRAGRQTAAKQ